MFVCWGKDSGVKVVAVCLHQQCRQKSDPHRGGGGGGGGGGIAEDDDLLHRRKSQELLVVDEVK
ncbi:hypothetical protein Acr_08g0012440 [Actinidia rufa]|uniref:Uncharacterized protein n=1 Tax=Actinidia rufa TaxID=165716 RepID=A0A7J0F2C2_9ERIC|nr:hypothetical protein Acr_08g0012440 [Actinidia rufa]